MILTLTPNPALDLTYLVDDVRPWEEHRVREVYEAPGGKGVNVARVLAQLGVDGLCGGLLGGAPGEQIRALLTEEGIAQRWTPITGNTRRTVTAIADRGATGFNEPGPAVTAEELTALRSDLTDALSRRHPRIDAVTISGSLPPGADGAFLADLVRLVRDQGRPVLVDTSGPALMSAARAGASVLKPNADEAIAATGAATPLEAAIALTEHGVPLVICSLGADGMLGIQRAGDRVRAWHARLPAPVSGNPTGAGDSVVAVLASTLLIGDSDLPHALRRAVAVGASAVTRPVAGQIDIVLADGWEPHILIEEIECH